MERIVEGLVFPEAPRWYGGSLWLSDIHAHAVVRFDEHGQELARYPFGDRVSGLGFLLDGTPIVVSMLDRRLLTVDGAAAPAVHADLSSFCDGFLNDMVVDATGRAYVGARNVGGGAAAPLDAIVLARPDGSVEVVAPRMQSPNGSVVTPDGTTLIVAETSQARLTAFTIAADGTLHDRRVFAEVPGLHPDGICLDAEGAVWFGSPITTEFVRVREGGEVTDRIATPGQWAVACVLGGSDGRTLFGVTGRNSVANIERVGNDRAADVTSDARGEVWVARVAVPAAGF
jgi:sugar lactone lactonase YvrE